MRPVFAILNFGLWLTGLLWWGLVAIDLTWCVIDATIGYNFRIQRPAEFKYKKEKEREARNRKN